MRARSGMSFIEDEDFNAATGRIASARIGSRVNGATLGSRPLGSPPVLAGPLARNFQPTSGSFGSKREINSTSKLKGNKFANYPRTIATPAWCLNWGTAALLPFDKESSMRTILQPPPSDRHSTDPVGECTILCGVGGQFVKNSCDRLCSLRFHGHAWTFGLGISPCVGLQFPSNDFSQRGAAPVILAQQLMCTRQRLDATIQSSHEIRLRTAGFLRLSDNSADRGKHVLYAMVEFGVERALMLLCAFALRDIDADAHDSLGLAITAVGNSTAPLNPSYLAVCANNTVFYIVLLLSAGKY